MVFGVISKNDVSIYIVSSKKVVQKRKHGFIAHMKDI